MMFTVPIQSVWVGWTRRNSKWLENTLYLKAGTQLDFETAQVLQVSVDVDDPSIGVGVDASSVVLIAVGDVNDAPKLSLSL